MKIIKKYENGKDAAIIPIEDLSEIFWQAAINYASKYKYYKQKKAIASSDFNKERAKQLAVLVWQFLGFDEKDIKERQKIFENTILREGGTWKGVNDYFCDVLPLEEKSLKGFTPVRFS